MRHRIGSSSGIGNSEPPILNNNFNMERDLFWDGFLNDLIANFKTIAEYGGFDYKLDKEGNFLFGIEPSYKYDDLQILCINTNDKGLCSLTEGRAWGLYGTSITSRTKYYSEYKRNCKFTRFIDSWYLPIVEKLKKVKIYD